jgi:hypothetical protein
MFESPASWRDFTSIFIKIMEFNKAQADEKAQHTFEYVSILKRFVMHPSVIELARIPLRGATQLSDARWRFETTSRTFLKNSGSEFRARRPAN